MGHSSDAGDASPQGAGGRTSTGASDGGGAAPVDGGATDATSAGAGGRASGGAAGAASGGAAGAASGGAGGTASRSCSLNTGYEGDEQCIAAPPSDKGWQLHIGPSSYTNPQPDYVVQPGQELTTDFPAISGNDRDVYFLHREYRLRPSVTHIAIAAVTGGIGSAIGAANRSLEYPAGGLTAPENASAGILLKAHSNVNVSLHAINTTPQPVLREIWVNFWYVIPGPVNQVVNEWQGIPNSPTFNVPPHTKQTLGPYSCTVQGNGRMLWLYGYRLANDTRFKVSRVRGARTDVIYDAYKWDTPLLLEYASTVTNRAPDIGNGIEGGWSGILDLTAGDKIEWSCDVDNKQDTSVVFSYQTFTGEMCVIHAESVGATCAK